MSEVMEKEEFVRSAVVAKELGLKRAMVMKLAMEGIIPSFRPNPKGNRFYHVSEVREALNLKEESAPKIKSEPVPATAPKATLSDLKIAVQKTAPIPAMVPKVEPKTNSDDLLEADDDELEEE